MNQSNAVSGTFIKLRLTIHLFLFRRKSLAFYRGNNFAGLEVELSEIVAARKLKASSETSQEGKHGIMVRWTLWCSVSVVVVDIRVDIRDTPRDDLSIRKSNELPAMKSEYMQPHMDVAAFVIFSLPHSLLFQDRISFFIGRLSSRRFLGPFLGVGVVSILMRLSGYAVISHFTATFLSDSGLPNYAWHEAFRTLRGF